MRRLDLMGLVARPRAHRLPGKLLQVRLALGVSQNGILRKLGIEEYYNRTAISGYEIGEREPSLPVLLKYAQAANVYIDALVDDTVDLPDRIPNREKSAGVKSRVRAKSRQPPKAKV